VIQGVTEAVELRSTDCAESTDNEAVAISEALSSVVVAHGELDCNLDTSERRDLTCCRVYTDVCRWAASEPYTRVLQSADPMSRSARA